MRKGCNHRLLSAAKEAGYEKGPGGVGGGGAIGTCKL